MIPNKAKQGEESNLSTPRASEKPNTQKEESNESEESRWKVRDVSLSDIQPRKTFWLIDQYLPLAELSLLAGREGLGKSTLAVEIASQVTQGLLLEEPKNVGYVALEDSLDRTIRTRFEVAGADLDRVKIPHLQRVDSKREMIFPKDYEPLLEWVLENEIKFLVLDPLVSVLSEKADSHNDKSIRPALESIVKLANNGQVAILGLVHINKGNESDFSNRILGSRAFSAVPRAVLGLTPDNEDPEERKLLLGVAKSSLTEAPKTMKSFFLESATVQTVEGETHSGRVVWLEDQAGRINERLGERFNEEEHSINTEIKEFLLDLFFNKGLHTKQGLKLLSESVKHELKEAGYPCHSEALQKYKRLVKAQRLKESGVRNGSFFWHIPNSMFTHYYPEHSDSIDSLDSSSN